MAHYVAWMLQSWVDFPGESTVEITFYWLQVLICSHSTKSPEKPFTKWEGSITPMQCCVWTSICFRIQINKCTLQQKKMLVVFKLRWKWLSSYWRYQKRYLTPLLCPQTWTLPCHLYPFHEKRKYGAETQRFSVPVLFPTLLVSSHCKI